MRAGLLRHRVALQTLSGTTALDSRGRSQKSWTLVEDRLPAAIEQLTGREGELARQQYPTATHLVRMRYRSDVTRDKRLKFGSRVFNILEVRNLLEIGRELNIVVGEEL